MDEKKNVRFFVSQCWRILYKYAYLWFCIEFDAWYAYSIQKGIFPRNAARFCRCTNQQSMVNIDLN